MTQPDLSLCAVCGEPAQFTDADPGANPVSYDARHLPEHLRGRAEAGQMPLQDGSTMDELYEKAQQFDIEGRSTMTKTQLQTAVAAATATEELAKQGRGFNRGGLGDPARPPVDPFAPAPPAPPGPAPRPRLTPEAEAVEQQYTPDSGEGEQLEGGTMSDATPTEEDWSTAADHAVESAGDEKEQPKKAAPRRSSKKK